MLAYAPRGRPSSMPQRLQAVARSFLRTNPNRDHSLMSKPRGVELTAPGSSGLRTGQTLGALPRFVGTIPVPLTQHEVQARGSVRTSP
jgi:hypothetical protein